MSNAKNLADFGKNVGDSGSLTLDSNGNVGIGTTGPAGPLHIQSATNRTLILDGTFATGSYTWQSVRRSGTEKWRWFLENDDDITLYGDVNSTGQLMRWTSDGKVGINRTPTDVALEVAGAAYTGFDGPASFFLYGDANYNDAGNAGSGILFGGEYTSTSTLTTFALISGIKENTNNTDYAGALTFQTRPNGSTPVERMRIDSSGLVGIGVSSGLAALLTVNGSTSVNTLTLGARNPAAGYNHISETGSGVMGIWGHNATAHPTTINAVKNTVTGWYSHFMRVYYDHGISFHTSASTIGTDNTTVWDNASQGSATSKERLRITVGGEVQIWGDSGSNVNRLKLSYNSTSGVATFGPHSTGGSTSLNIGTADSGTYATKMQITNDGRVKAANSYKFNLVTVVTYDNSTQNTVQTGMNNQVFLISIHHSAGVSAILCLPNGGSGVAYDFQMSDPDSGTFTNTNSVSFTMAGTGGNTFTAQILGGSGNVVVQRTAGSGSYTVYINQILGGLV